VIDPTKEKEKENTREESKQNKFSKPTRRDFLKGVAIGAGAVALSPIAAKKADAIDVDVFAMKPSIRGEVVAAGRIEHDFRKCVGCRVCEVACAMKLHGEVNPHKSRIKIYTYQPTVFIGIVCQQCGDRPCVNACPVEPDKDGRRALYVDPKTNALAVNYDRCINCGKCVDACSTNRNGNIYMNDDEYPDGMCVLCGECVKQCPQNALGILPRTTDGKYGAKQADLLAEEAIELLYGGKKTIVDNWK